MHQKQQNIVKPKAGRKPCHKTKATMTKQQQVGIELLKEFATTEYKINLENNKLAEQFEEGINTAKWMVKTILEQTGLL